MLSDPLVRVALSDGQHLINVFSAPDLVLYVTSHLRTHVELEQVVTAQSTYRLLILTVLASYRKQLILVVFPLRRLRTLLSAVKRKHELLHFVYVTQ
jgi:hypothetical protein